MGKYFPEHSISILSLNEPLNSGNFRRFSFFFVWVFLANKLNPCYICKINFTIIKKSEIFTK